MMNKTEKDFISKTDIPMVSIAMITYNHEKYIAEALDSILSQKVDFEYEIVVGEDFSTDNTRKILLEYVAAYPDKIKPLLHEKNIKGLPNFIETLRACKGKYIALLEGDDYWTDPLKLKKQVDFLEFHEEYNMVFHNAKVLHHTKDGIQIKSFNSDEKDRDYTATEIIQTWCVPTASALCKNEEQYRYLEDNPWLPVGDDPFFIKCASLGKVYYMAEQMSVYRRVSTGFMDSGEKNTVEFRLTFIKYLEALYSDFSDLFSKEFIDRKVIIAHFWAAYKFKIIGSEECCSQYMEHTDPQVIFEDLIKPKDEKIRSLEKHILSQNKIILELEEEMKRVKN